MQVVKENKAFKLPRERTVGFFSRNDLFFSRDLHLSFVCGAADPAPNKQPGFRGQFLNWVLVNEPKLICVRAESAVTDLLLQIEERKAASNLAVIENFIAETVDSLLIFPESPGSFAELGMFSANDQLCEKTLVAVLAKYQGDSFITLGPVKHISGKSKFSPLPVVLRKPYHETFRQISDRLLGEIKNERGYRRRYTKKEWKEYAPREQLAILDCIFDLIGICTEDDLFDIINKAFGAYERSEIRLLTGLLVALRRAVRTPDADIIRCVAATANRFIEGADEKVIDLKAMWTDAYSAHSQEAIQAFAEVNP